MITKTISKMNSKTEYITTEDDVIQVSQFVSTFRFDDLEQFTNVLMNTEFDFSKLSILGPLFKDKPNFLCLAAYYNALKIGEYLIQNGFNIDQSDEVHRTAIHFAGAGGSLDFINLIKSNNGDLNATDKYQKSYIHYAAEYNHVNVLNQAFMSGDNLDVLSAEGCPIHLACKNGNFRAIEFLAQTEQCDLNRSVHDRLPVLHTLNSSCYEALPLLIKYGMNIDQVMIGNWTTLYYVIRTGSSHIVEILLNLGANPNRPPNNKNGWSPMHVAAEVQNSQIIDLLFNHGGLIHCLTSQSVSPFSLAQRPLSTGKSNSTPYTAAKTIRDHEVEFFARYFFLSMLTGKKEENYADIVAQSIRKRFYQPENKIDPNSEAAKPRKNYANAPLKFNP